MIQRFQVLVFPDVDRSFRYIDRRPDCSAEATIGNIFDRILELKPAEPSQFKFSPDAQEVFVWWLEELESRLRSGKLNSSLTAHLSKYRGLMPRLALIFEIAERISKGFDGFVSSNVRDRSVSLENALYAVDWCTYLESHANRIYSIFSPEVVAAQALAEKIKQRSIGKDGFFTCRDVYTKGWRGLKSPPIVKGGLNILETKHWIRFVVEPTDSIGGRPSDRAQVNPLVWSMDLSP